MSADCNRVVGGGRLRAQTRLLAYFLAVRGARVVVAEPDARSVYEAVSELLRDPGHWGCLTTLHGAFASRNSWPVFIDHLNDLYGIRVRTN